VAVVAPDATLEVAQPAALAAHAVGGQAAAPSVGASGVPVNPSPMRLLIPRIGVDARIEARGLDSNRNMLTPNHFQDVAWYDLGPRPGQPGNALMNGHVDWWTGSAVFTRLSDLRRGDYVIVVRRDGTRITFKVTGRQTVTANARVAALFAPSSVATLTLITCTGVWDPRIMSDTHRLLVSAVLA
ncbi:MAG TPA: class F sortase, partial [Candidatus Dormibacteraeota bacterium]|nr:class F sortase [Candidatus Dormibacteraeota bacterium]